MDAWVGLWFWPLDTGVRPPSWAEWLAVAEDLIRPDERHGLTGQLDLFDDLCALLDDERQRQQGHVTVRQLRDGNPWLSIAVDAARREGAWHWELEFAPEFQRGGFDLQVGNPPWVRLDWQEDLALAEFDPWWGLVDKRTAKQTLERREMDLNSAGVEAPYLSELASASGLVAQLGSAVLHPVLSGTRTNLYTVFMETAWRHAAARDGASLASGVVGLLHQDAHLSDPRATALRRGAYRRLRLRAEFYNELKLFEDVLNNKSFSVNVYGSPRPPHFRQVSWLLHPSTLDGSLLGAVAESPPGVQFPNGGWDTRPDGRRVVEVDEEALDVFRKLADDERTPVEEARVLRPVSSEAMAALSVLTAVPRKLADVVQAVSSGMNETESVKSGSIYWEVRQNSDWESVVIQGSHFGILNLLSQEPRWDCVDRYGFEKTPDMEILETEKIPRTAYQLRSGSSDLPSSVASADYRLIHREFVGPVVGERTYQAAILPPGAQHVHSCLSSSFGDPAALVGAAGVSASIVADYLFKVIGSAHIGTDLHGRLPLPTRPPGLWSAALSLRTLRLACVTSVYGVLWKQCFQDEWAYDSWTNPSLRRPLFDKLEPSWSASTPLRREEDRWQALVEIDALTALMLGLDVDQLCSLYRDQFSVLRKYEFGMVFDSQGRRICRYHKQYGGRQGLLQAQAKAGDLPSDWKSLWDLYEQHELDPGSVDWLGLFEPPFVRVDREAAMTHAYNEFQRRVGAGE